jgi:tRNA(fMet)-specific endonuclease VapC
VNHLLNTLSSADFDAIAAKKYGEVRAFLEKEGKSIGGNDLLIASIALVIEATLVSRNESEYRRVPGLAFERW